MDGCVKCGFELNYFWWIQTILVCDCSIKVKGSTFWMHFMATLLVERKNSIFHQIEENHTKMKCKNVLNTDIGVTHRNSSVKSPAEFLFYKTWNLFCYVWEQMHFNLKGKPLMVFIRLTLHYPKVISAPY